MTSDPYPGNIIPTILDSSNSSNTPIYAIISIIALVILLIFSAYFSMTETAFTSFNKIRMEHNAKTSKSAKAVMKISHNYDRVISTILIGNNIVNIAAASIATILFVNHFGDIGATYATIVVTLVILIFGEVSPKSIAKENPEVIAKLTVYPLYFFYIIFFPISFILELIQKLIKKLARVGKRNPVYTEEEFSMLVEDMNEARVLNDIEENIIQNTIEYGDTKVEDIMIPKKEIICIKERDSLDKIASVFVESNRSRLLVCKNSKIDSAYGFLHQKDFFEFLYKKETNLKKIIITDILIAKPTNKISRLFKRMQKEHQHMALVKDEEHVVGIVTMEDILEELVGDIKDENDED